MARSPTDEIMARVKLADDLIDLLRASGLMGKKRGRKPGKKIKAAGVKADGTPKAKPGPKPKKAPPAKKSNGEGQLHAQPIE